MPNSPMSPPNGTSAPALPSRTHVARPSTQVEIFVGGGETLDPTTISAVCGAISPAWSMSAYPRAQR